MTKKKVIYFMSSISKEIDFNLQQKDFQLKAKSVFGYYHLKFSRSVEQYWSGPVCGEWILVVVDSW